MHKHQPEGRSNAALFLFGICQDVRYQNAAMDRRSKEARLKRVCHRA
jgi:hypothetical protein